MSKIPNLTSTIETSTGKTAKAGLATAENVVKTGREASEKAFSTGTEAATKAYDQAFGMATEAVHKTFPQAAAQFGEFAGLHRANIEAAMAAGSSAMKGIEAFSAQMLAFNTQVMEDGIANVEKLLACKSVPDMVETNRQCAMAQLQHALAHGSKMADLALKFAGDVAAPVHENIGRAAEKLSKQPRA